MDCSDIYIMKHRQKQTLKGWGNKQKKKLNYFHPHFPKNCLCTPWHVYTPLGRLLLSLRISKAEFLIWAEEGLFVYYHG